MFINQKRIHQLNNGQASSGPVIYWMSREQRVHDNWGLLHARNLAGNDQPLIVVFCLATSFLGATLRHYDFMLKGLQEVERELRAYDIPFSVLVGDPAITLPEFSSLSKAGAVVTDFDPLRIKQGWQREVGAKLSIPLIEVDGHNVIPARVVSTKQEYAARTIRPKIHKVSGEFLEDFPVLQPNRVPVRSFDPVDWTAVSRALDFDESVSMVDLAPGPEAANEVLSDFVQNRLYGYARKRNDPNEEGTSRLSAYFHFGQLAPQRAALAVASSGKGEDQEAYLED